MPRAITFIGREKRSEKMNDKIINFLRKPSLGKYKKTSHGMAIKEE